MNTASPKSITAAHGANSTIVTSDGRAVFRTMGDIGEVVDRSANVAALNKVARIAVPPMPVKATTISTGATAKRKAV